MRGTANWIVKAAEKSMNIRDLEKRIWSEIEEAFSALDLNPDNILPATPFRRQLRQQLMDENKRRRQEAAEKVEQRYQPEKEAMMAREILRIRRVFYTWTPEGANRRLVHKRLVELGFACETMSMSGSTYYELEKEDKYDIPRRIRLRVSNHSVPMTEERAESSWSWAIDGLHVDVRGSQGELLERLASLPWEIEEECEYLAAKDAEYMALMTGIPVQSCL